MRDDRDEGADDGDGQDRAGQGDVPGVLGGDRDAVEGLIGAAFEFHSPADERGLDRAGWFERCWPGAGSLTEFEFVRLVEHGEEVVVTYEATRRDGSRFRNTEVLGFDRDKLARVEMYFGWNL